MVQRGISVTSEAWVCGRQPSLKSAKTASLYSFASLGRLGFVNRRNGRAIKDRAVHGQRIRGC